MKVLVTGSSGFVGKNLISHLELIDGIEIFKYDRASTEEDLERYTRDCEFVFHLAGVNRPENPAEFMDGNFGFTSILLDKLKQHNNKSPIMLASSIQAELDNDYGKSKKAGEDLIFQYGEANNVETFVYRFPNLFGKWCRPNYNSVIATWCYNVSHDIAITVDNPDKELVLAYIDDVCQELIKCLSHHATKSGHFCIVPITYTKTLGEISDLIKSFKQESQGILVPSTGDPFTKDLYTTYISYVPLEEMIVDLDEHRDERGVFCELVRTKECGQISVSTTKPYVARGGHYHHTKIERFIVVKGRAKITFEHIIDHSKIEFEVSGDKLQYVNIPVGYQHSINNIGDEELVLIIWSNELFSPDAPDTFIMDDKE